jgi:large subunit ribosomal protein L25
MANSVVIEAETRAVAGKGAARATRRQGLVPAVIYGAKQPATLLSLDPRFVMRELIKGGWRSRLYEVNVGGESNRVLMREVQFHPVTDQPVHVDFQRLAAGEKVRVSVSVKFTNELLSPGLKRGAVMNVVHHSVECYCDPDAVPEYFIADLTGLEVNDNVRWSNLKGTDGVKPTSIEKDFVIASVAATKGMEAAASDTPAAPAGKAPAKGKAAPKPAAKK